MRAIGRRRCRHLLWSATMITAVTLLSLSRLLAQSDNQHQLEDTSRFITELISIVSEHGWLANMGRLCVAFKLGPEGDCRFKQIAVSGGPPDVIDNYGFSVPFNVSAPSYAVMFHLGPLVGNFFVVSADGSLKSSFYRARGVDFTEVPNREAQSAFEASMAFWAENLPRLKAMIAAGNVPRR
jgi:hypothetical protein